VACRGGQANPVICVPPKRHSDDYGECVCQLGYFIDSDDTCKECTAGFFCPDGKTRNPCPVHTYQDGTQSPDSRIECTKCTSTGDEYGRPIQYCPEGKQAAWCDRTSLAASQSRPIGDNCMDCVCCNSDYYESRLACKTNCYI